MKKLLLVMLLALWVLIPMFAFAQTAQIIDVKGDVQVRMAAVAVWEKAAQQMLLGNNAEIKTGIASQCTLAFDLERNNILTVKENSLIKLASIKPGKVDLSEGRVFTLINSIAKVEKFEIKTPTAIAGARGTGWGTGYNGASTDVSCFENTVYVQGLDANGNPTSEQDLAEGFGLDIPEGGMLGELQPLDDADRSEWNEFSSYADGLSQGSGNADDDLGIDDAGPGAFEDALGEGRDDYRDGIDEMRRQEEEIKQEPVQSEYPDTNVEGPY
ncbi:MAG: FecR domain-containing protein [Candidatus Omnitrophica bacterium]|nr:FecR domain-containing protein [Candidatus Omnitrophota bacterium]